MNRLYEKLTQYRLSVRKVEHGYTVNLYTSSDPINIGNMWSFHIGGRDHRVIRYKYKLHNHHGRLRSMCFILHYPVGSKQQEAVLTLLNYLLMTTEVKE